MTGRIEQQLGNYRLTRLLGTGGFAEVYLGEHIYLNTEAAIKVLRSQLAEEDMGSFHTEARTAAQLVHPHIIRVLDFGVDNRTPFLVMDYASNGTLRQRYPRGSRLPAQTILSHVRQIAAALQYAHDQGLIHCDVKPENLFIGSKDEILLGDFGIALAVQSIIHRDKRITAGTVAYMAPEQIEVHPCPASDQYALGVVVYEWLTGERPFEGTTFMEFVVKHCTIPPPPLRAKVNTVSPDTEMAVLKALAKDPQQRFVNVQAFADALEDTLLDAPTWHLKEQSGPRGPELLARPEEVGRLPDASLMTRAKVPSLERQTQPSLLLASSNVHKTQGVEVSDGAVAEHASEIHTLPPSGSRAISRRHIMLGLTGLGIGAAAGVGASLLFASHLIVLPFDLPFPSSSDVGRRLVTYTKHKAPIYTLTWSPDQHWIASGSGDGQAHVWDASNGEVTAIYLGHSKSVNTLAWCPTINHVVSAGGDLTVQVWDAIKKTNIVTLKGHAANIRTVCWSPDGSQIASGDDAGELFLWHLNDSVAKQIIPTLKTRIWSAAWSPDGTMLAWGGDDGIVHIWGVLEQKEVLAYEGHLRSNVASRYVTSLAWSPDSVLVASGSDDHTVHVWSVEPGAAYQTTVYTGHHEAVDCVAWAPRGHYIASGGHGRTVQVWDPHNDNLIFTYTQHTDAVHAIVWSPDSQLIASCCEDRTVHVWKAPR